MGRNQASFLTLLSAQKVIPVSAALMAVTADSMLPVDSKIPNNTMELRHFLNDNKDVHIDN